MTVGTQTLRLVDERFGDGPRYHLTEPKDIDMRVPDQVRKCVLFVGLPDMPDPQYRGTAFIVTVPGQHNNRFAFMVTARHVAERLQGKEFYIRADKKDGQPVEMVGKPDNPWWYHPTQKQHVDSAVTIFSPQHFEQLDIEHIPIAMFADDEQIKKHDLGVGDDVFIVGLFTKLAEATHNIPIVRTGNVAALPGERFPFADRMIEAHLIESRSIGGLSGSPVFIRETLGMPVGKSNSAERAMFSGLGRFFLFGSLIGHWDVPEGFTPTQAEAVNMGIAPVVPAQKIKETILQPELVDMMKRVNHEMRAKNQKGATLDFAESGKQPFTKQDFEAALKKVTRKVEPQK